MDFDEYEYLEKTVEETTKNESIPTKDSEREKKRRDRSDDSEIDETEEKEHRKSSSSKKSRSVDNGKDRDRDRERERSSRRRSRERDSEKERLRDSDRDRERPSSRDRERERSRSSRDRRSSRDVEEKDVRSSRDRDRDRERRERERERETSRRSRSRSRLEVDRERDFVRERSESRRYRDKKEATEPEADPERDQRTVFAYQMPLKATERDVFEFFSQAGKVRDVKLIMDRNSRRSKGVGYIEFVDVMSVPMAIALSGHAFLGQPIMVKPSEAEKNLVQSTTSTGGSGVTGPYGATDRKLYVGNLHFNVTEPELKAIFEAFGPVELVQLPTDPETGHCKGFGFIQFVQVEHAKAAQSLNGALEIAGRTIKVSCVTDHVTVQDSGTKTADFDDDDGGGLSLNAQSRAILMQKLDRTGIASSFVGAITNGASPIQPAVTLPINPTAMLPTPPLPAPIVSEPIGIPSECLLLKNMFDPATEVDLEFDLDIRDDVQEECSKYGRVRHIYVDKNSAGYVYLRFENVESASRAQQAMHHRWFAQKLISAIFLQPYEYDAKFKGAA